MPYAPPVMYQPPHRPLLLRPLLILFLLLSPLLLPVLAWAAEAAAQAVDPATALQMSFATLFSYGLGTLIKHALPKVPNGAIPAVAALAPPLLTVAADSVLGFTPFPSNPFIAAAFGGLAVAFHSTGKHLGESMGMIRKE